MSGSTISIPLAHGRTLEFVQGDITAQHTDAVVNAANSSLLGGAGVDGAIHRAGGPAILAACRKIRDEQWPDGLPTGKAVATTGGNLPARHVIHTVGPIYRGVEAQARQLADCYRNSIALADTLKLTSISFPSISTGAYGYPIELAAPIAVRAVADALASAGYVRLARFVLFDPSTFRAYADAARSLSSEAPSSQH